MAFSNSAIFWKLPSIELSKIEEIKFEIGCCNISYTYGKQISTSFQEQTATAKTLIKDNNVETNPLINPFKKYNPKIDNKI